LICVYVLYTIFPMPIQIASPVHWLTIRSSLTLQKWRDRWNKQKFTKSNWQRKKNLPSKINWKRYLYLLNLNLTYKINSFCAFLQNCCLSGNLHFKLWVLSNSVQNHYFMHDTLKLFFIYETLSINLYSNKIDWVSAVWCKITSDFWESS
jgi:hypothetical protein